MEGQPSSAGNFTPRELCGFQDLQGSVRTHQGDNPQFYRHYPMIDSQTRDVFPLGMRYVQESPMGTPFLDSSRVERGQSSVYEHEEMNCAGEAVDGLDEVGQEKEFPWQRTKWTEKMVKLLITAVSYVEEGCVVGSRKRKSVVLQKKGKWKCVSRAMVERGYMVSPRQCEDKFSDLNKRFKKLNEVLGRGTACQVVENPKLLRLMNITEKSKEGVRKILSSKHLCYEQMCSYHNHNRLFLPHDPDLQLSLQSALAEYSDSEDHDSNGPQAGSFDKANCDGRGEIGADHLGMLPFPEWLKQADESEDTDPCDFFRDSDRNMIDAQSKNLLTDLNQFCPDGYKTEKLQSQEFEFRLLQLKKQKLHLKAQMVEIEKLQLKWQRTSLMRDRELDKMRQENECLKLENEHIALQIERKKMGAL